MVKNIVTIVVLIFIASSLASADVTSVDIEGAIDKSKLKHPYLYFSEEDKPGIRKRIKNDPVYRDIMDKLAAEAHRLLFTPADSSPPERPKDPVYDNTWPFERYILNQTSAAFNLAFMYQMTGEKKYARKAFEFIDIVCDLPTWVHGYHEFPIFYDRR